MLESDCAAAVAVVIKRAGSLSRTWTIYRDIEMFRKMLPDCIIRKMGRECNGSAQLSGGC